MIPALLTDTVSTDLQRATGYALLWGLEAVELRMVGTSRVPDVETPRIIRILVEAELPVVAVCPGLFEGPATDRSAWLNEILQLSSIASVCEKLGTSTVLVSCFSAGTADDSQNMAIEAFQRAGEVATGLGIQLLVQNDRQSLAPTTKELLHILRSVDHSGIMAAWQPHEAVMAGESVAEGLDTLGSLIKYVRVRDVVKQSGGWIDTSLGAGQIAWPELLDGLVALNYGGPLTLEVHTKPTGSEGLASATYLVRQIRAAASRVSAGR